MYGALQCPLIINGFFLFLSFFFSFLFLISLCFYTPSAPFTTALGLRFSDRAVVMAGGILVALGYMMSAFAEELLILYVTYGLIAGERNISRPATTFSFLLKVDTAP